MIWVAIGGGAFLCGYFVGVQVEAHRVSRRLVDQFVGRRAT